MKSEVGRHPSSSLVPLVLAGTFVIIGAAVSPSPITDRWYVTSTALRQDATISSMIFFAAAVFATFSRGQAGWFGRRILPWMIATSGCTLIFVVLGLQVMLDEHQSTFREPPPPTWLDWQEWSWLLLTRGACLWAVVTAFIVMVDWYLSGFSGRVRRIFQVALILGVLVLVDQVGNPDLVGGGTVEHCGECGASRGTIHGTFHGFFEYHQGEKSGGVNGGTRGFFCDHRWNGEFENFSY